MNKILIVDDEDEIREILTIMIESIGPYEVLEANSGNKAIEVLKSNPNIGLILCDYRMSDGNGGDVYTFLKDFNSKIPYVLVSTSDPNDIPAFKDFFVANKLNGHILKPFSETIVSEIIEKRFISDFDQVGGIKVSEQYAKMRISTFLKFNLAVKVYIKISDEKFIKISDGQNYQQEVVEKYANKGLRYIYLEKDDYQKLISESSHKAFGDKSGLTGIERVHELVKNLGINEFTTTQVEEVLHKSIELVKSQPAIFDILNDLNKREDFLYEHAYLCAFLSCALAKDIGWTQEAVWQKLIFASLFQNIALEEPEEAMIYQLETDDYFKLSLDQRTIVKNHMQLAAKKFERLGLFTEEVKNLVLNHHEQPDGKGFPRKLQANNINAMESLFILASNISSEILKQNLPKALIKDYVLKQASKYGEGHFKKPYVSLVQLASR